MQFGSGLFTMINSIAKSWFTKVSEFLVVMEVSKIMKTYQDINKETIDRWVEVVGNGGNQLHMMHISVRKMENGKFFLLLHFRFHMSGWEI